MAKILLVDDDEDFADLTAQLLSKEQHTVEVVYSGAQCLEKLDSNRYELLILDWDLPDLNGINILRRFREAGGTAPVMLMTGHKSDSDKELGLDIGADDYVTKPCSSVELKARVRALLRRARQQPCLVHEPLGSNNKDLLERAKLTGTSLASRYEFLEVLGEGGIGIVFKARHPQLDKLVAIKMIQERELGPEVLARFEQEARAISRLDHPNIAVIHDFGTTEQSRPYMVMDFIEGKDLERIIREQNELDLISALDLAVQVCDGMSHAHSMGVIHRDLKPSNLILKNTGEVPVVKIVDFGCAKLRSLNKEKAPVKTQAGEIIGSPAYMSPEHARADSIDERSDIYSLGCILYEMLTGFVPHPGENALEVLLKHLNEDAVPLQVARQDLQFPAGTERLIGKVLAREPAKRYQTMQELKQDLLLLKSSVQQQPNATRSGVLESVRKGMSGWFRSDKEVK